MLGERERQLSSNAQSRDRWHSFAEHRTRVSDLARPDPGPDMGRLRVLGAGNCNDPNLPTLLKPFSEVHLVDLDADSLASGFAVSRVGLRGVFAVSGLIFGLVSSRCQT